MTSRSPAASRTSLRLTETGARPGPFQAAPVNPLPSLEDPMITFRLVLPRPLLFLAAAAAVVAGSYGWAALHGSQPASPILPSGTVPFRRSSRRHSRPAALP